MSESNLNGVRYLVLAALSFSLMTLFARVAGESVPSLEIVFVRSLLTLTITFTLLRRAGVSDWWGQNRRLLFLRGTVGFAALSCVYYAVTHMPLAEATVIQFSSPIFTALLAWAYLGETATIRLWIAIGLGGVGLLMITRPPALFGDAASRLPPAVVAVAAAGAFLTAWAHVLVRRLANAEHELVIILYFPLVAVPGSLVAGAPEFVWPSAWAWLMLLGVGLAAQAGQITLTRGMKDVPAGPASVIMYLQVLFATLWGIIFLGEQPDPWTIGGSLLVLGGSLVAARRPR
ncbi:MAG: DMT family transporter, partial [Acidobacteriota bacterium]